MKNSPQNVSSFASHSVGFLDDFMRAFGKNPDEMNAISLKTRFEKGKIDTEYLGKMLLNGSPDAWLHLANMQISMDFKSKHLSELLEDLYAYIANPDFLAEDFDNDFPEISKYFTEKFPKTTFATERFHTRTENIISH